MKKILTALMAVFVTVAVVRADTPLPNRPNKIVVPWAEMNPWIDQTVTQLTSTSTAVTCNGYSGVITMFAGTIGAVTTTSFTVNNTAVHSGSSVTADVCGFAGTYVTNGIPVASVGSVANGSFVINVTNVHATNATGANAIKVAFQVM